jgi:hypothetical protein
VNLYFRNPLPFGQIAVDLFLLVGTDLAQTGDQLADELKDRRAPMDGSKKDDVVFGELF